MKDEEDYFTPKRQVNPWLSCLRLISACSVNELLPERRFFDGAITDVGLVYADHNKR